MRSRKADERQLLVAAISPALPVGAVTGQTGRAVVEQAT